MGSHYIIIKHSDIDRLQGCVNEHMQRGYMPIGSIVIDNHSSTCGITYFLQSMILVQYEGND